MVQIVTAIDVDLELSAGTDSAAPGGSVTVALCGSWEHDGHCRWPHNSRIEPDAHPVRLRTVVAAPADETDDVLARVEGALRGDRRWRVLSFESGATRPEEAALAASLAADT